MRSVGFLFDLQEGDTKGNPERVMPHLRFLNAEGGEHVQKWQFKRRTTPFKALGTENKTVTHYHMTPEDWEDVPGGAQRLGQPGARAGRGGHLATVNDDSW